MVWLQRWLGSIYSDLYCKFGRGTFTFADSLRALGAEEGRLAVAFSKLRRAGALSIFARSRPRLYRLIDPRSFLLIVGGEILRPELKQEQYLQLVYDTFRVFRSRLSLTSFAVYGSVARGDAKPTSDLDILLISEDFSGSLASRMDSLSWVDREVADEMSFLAGQNIRPLLSFYPLRREEASSLPVLFLDITVDCRAVYDSGGFLGNTLRRLSAKLDLLGARKVVRDRGWYWDVKPDYQPGDVIEI